MGLLFSIISEISALSVELPKAIDESLALDEEKLSSFYDIFESQFLMIYSASDYNSIIDPSNQYILLSLNKFKYNFEIENINGQAICAIIKIKLTAEDLRLKEIATKLLEDIKVKYHNPSFNEISVTSLSTDQEKNLSSNETLNDPIDEFIKRKSTAYIPQNNNVTFLKKHTDLILKIWRDKEKEIMASIPLDTGNIIVLKFFTSKIREIAIQSLIDEKLKEKNQKEKIILDTKNQCEEWIKLYENSENKNEQDKYACARIKLNLLREVYLEKMPPPPFV